MCFRTLRSDLAVKEKSLDEKEVRNLIESFANVVKVCLKSNGKTKRYWVLHVSLNRIKCLDGVPVFYGFWIYFQTLVALNSERAWGSETFGPPCTSVIMDIVRFLLMRRVELCPNLIYSHEKLRHYTHLYEIVEVW